MKKMVVMKVLEPEAPEFVDYPKLVSFPQGIPSSSADLQLQVAQKGSGKKRKKVVVAQHGGVIFSSEGSEGTNKADLYKFGLAVLDESTGKLVIHPTDQAYILRPSVRGREEPVRNSTMSYAERKQSLTEEFGSRKKKRALQAAQSNTISSENIAGAAAVESAMVLQLTEDIDDGEVLIDAAEQALEQNRVKLLPTFNVDATEVEDAYPLSSLIPANVREAIEETFDTAISEFITASGGSEEVSTEPVEKNSKVTKQVVLDVWGRRLQSSPWWSSLASGYHAAFPPDLANTLKKSDRRSIRKTLVSTLMLEYALKLHRHLSSSFDNTVFKDELLTALDCSQDVFRYLSDSFTHYKKFKGRPALVASKSMM